MFTLFIFKFCNLVVVYHNLCRGLFEERATRSSHFFYLSNDVVVLDCASRSVSWWAIFENILYRVTKQDLDHGHETSTSFESFKATVLINFSQILLIPTLWAFSGTFRRSSNCPIMGFLAASVFSTDFRAFCKLSPISVL